MSKAAMTVPVNVYEAGTGAVRSNDLAAERWDLISWDAVALLLYVSDCNDYNFEPLLLVNQAIKEMGTFLGYSGDSNRLRDLGVGWWNLAVAIQLQDAPPTELKFLRKLKSHHYPYFALRRLATTCDEGAKKYAEENWHHGFQIKNLCNHGLRHLVKWTNGDRSEDHLGHSMWSFMAAIHTYTFRRSDMCQFLLDRNYTLTPELKKMHEEHASRRAAAKAQAAPKRRKRR